MGLLLKAVSSWWKEIEKESGERERKNERKRERMKEKKTMKRNNKKGENERLAIVSGEKVTRSQLKQNGQSRPTARVFLEYQIA